MVERGVRAGLCPATVSLAAMLLAAPGLAVAQTATGAPATAPPPPAPPAVHPPASAPKPKKPPPKPAENDDDDETTEVAPLTVHPLTRPPPQYGAVVGDIQPELQMSPADIQSYGVSTVTELLNEIAPQTRSDRGRTQQSPVILLNGRRISSINEVMNIPTEAILRIDILPEEVSLKYGYTADQRVVNIVLRRRFKAVTGEVVASDTTEGGDPSGEAEVDQFQVRRDDRTNFDLKYQPVGGLSDAQRGLTETASGAPFSFAGNVVSPTGGQIDPDLSTIFGEPLTVAGVPAGVTANQKLALQDFLPVANTDNIASDFSLLPATQTVTANAVVARPAFWGFNATLNATLQGTASDAAQGLPGVSLLVPAGDPFSPFGNPVTVDRFAAGERPLTQTIDGWTGHLGVTLNKDVGSWRLSLTTAYNHTDTITDTSTGLSATGLQNLLNAGSPTFNPFGPLPASLVTVLPQSHAENVTDGGNVQVLANGPVLKLPAGPLYASVKLGDVEAVDSSSSEGMRGGDQAQTLDRNIIQGQLNLDLPLASRYNHVLPWLGEFYVNGNAFIDEYSDLGPLPTLGYGINWTPIPGYNLIVSDTHDHLAPTIQQLEGPVIATPGVKVFDFTTGQTVDVTQLSGGNPALKPDDRDVVKVGLTLKPFPAHDFTFTANYITSHISNYIATLPSASAALEAALPGRFIRGADGELEEEDDTPINFASQDRQELRYGVNFSLPVGKQPPPRTFNRRQFQRRPNGGGPPGGFAGGGPGGPGGGPLGGDSIPGQGPGGTSGGDSDLGPGGGGRPGGGGGFGGGGFPGGGGGGGRGFGGGGRGGGGQPPGGRFQIAIYHTIIFRDQYLVAPGGPVLNLLDGSAMGSTGGQYQHEIEGQIGYTDNGYGARISADWRSGTTVDGGGAASTGTLDFSDITTVNLRLWDDFTPQKALITRYPLLRGVRMTFSVLNLFNQTISVHDSAGPTPLIYQGPFLDPTGRVVQINLRKIFY
jgi:hypothetical protein